MRNVTVTLFGTTGHRHPLPWQYQHHNAIPLLDQIEQDMAITEHHIALPSRNITWLHYTIATLYFTPPDPAALYQCRRSQCFTQPTLHVTKRACTIPMLHGTSQDYTLALPDDAKLYQGSTLINPTIPLPYHASLHWTQPLLYRNYDTNCINPINDYTLDSKPVYCYTLAVRHRPVLS